MKNFTKQNSFYTKYLLKLFSAIVVIFGLNKYSKAQTVVVIGVDHISVAPSVDAITFIAIQDIPANSVFYFSSGYYTAALSRFRLSSNTGDDPNNTVVKYTSPASIIVKGTVITIRETGTTTNTFTVTSASGTAGTALNLTINGLTGNFNLPSGSGSSWYSFIDNDDNPYNGITGVNGLFYTGYDENGVIVNGGAVPADLNPITNYPTAIIIDGFVGATTTFTEFKPSLRGNNLNTAALKVISNYDYNITPSPDRDLSVVAFTSFNVVTTNPSVTVAVSPSSVLENGAPNLVYTFTLSATNASATTINFSVGGNSTFGTDYSQTNAASFTTTTGTVSIPANTLAKTITIDPTADTGRELDETVIITATAGTGYVVGSPSIAIGTITNDDTGPSTPLVALVGINHADQSINPTHLDGFSFVALSDIPLGTIVYFTRKIFDKSTQAFINGYTGTVKWTAAAGVNRGDVYVVTETTADAFTVTCSDGSSCGTIANIEAGFSLPTGGIALYAYADNNDTPTDAINEIYSVIYTGDITVPTNGGQITAALNPTSLWPNAVVLDNFPNATPGRTEFKFAPGSTLRQNTVDRTALTLTGTNWLTGQSTATAPSTERFANITVTTGVANPLLTLSISPASILENAGVVMTYTFSLSQNAASNLTINFTVGGTAIYATDYNIGGSASILGNAGSIILPMGSNSASFTVIPTGDLVLEPDETVIMALNSGVGYDAGNPNQATGTIFNDDVAFVSPLVAIIGINHTTPDGFSFAATQNLAAGTEIYFSNYQFNNTSLKFGNNTAGSVLKYTVPAAGLAKGHVVYLVETGLSTNAFTVSCSAEAAGNCGTIAFLSGDFTMSSTGANLFAYSDTDADQTNGITNIYALFNSFSGNIASIQNPTAVFPNAIVVHGFASAAPDRIEYKFASGERALAIDITSLQNTNNYLVAQLPQNLSVVRFSAINPCPATSTWLGTTNNWNSPSNWSGNAVPGLCSDVIVNNGAPNMPLVSSNNTSCFSLTINTGANVNFGANAKITVNQ